MKRMKLYTIGFTRKSAEYFFILLSKADVQRIIDIRLNNVSQLAGFARRDDLRYFLKVICNIDYLHLPMLAPTKEILDEYRKNPKNWTLYETAFLRLIADREIEKQLEEDLIDGSCLLCSEETPDHCHRRLTAEYLLEKWGNIEITHLV
jgi:uncharacterized protein (DUF488 family)